MEDVSYDPYGKVTVLDASGAVKSSPAMTEILWTGRRLDTTGNYYFRSRYFNTALGRFISRDVDYLDGWNLYEGYFAEREGMDWSGKVSIQIRKFIRDANSASDWNTWTGLPDTGRGLFGLPYITDNVKIHGVTWLYNLDIDISGKKDSQKCNCCEFKINKIDISIGSVTKNYRGRYDYTGPSHDVAAYHESKHVLLMEKALNDAAAALPETVTCCYSSSAYMSYLPWDYGYHPAAPTPQTDASCAEKAKAKIASVQSVLLAYTHAANDNFDNKYEYPKDTAAGGNSIVEQLDNRYRAGGWQASIDKSYTDALADYNNAKAGLSSDWGCSN